MSWPTPSAPPSLPVCCSTRPFRGKSLRPSSLTRLRSSCTTHRLHTTAFTDLPNVQRMAAVVFHKPRSRHRTDAGEALLLEQVYNVERGFGWGRRAAVVLSEKDQIVDAKAVRKYLMGEESLRWEMKSLDRQKVHGDNLCWGHLRQVGRCFGPINRARNSIISDFITCGLADCTIC